MEGELVNETGLVDVPSQPRQDEIVPVTHISYWKVFALLFRYLCSSTVANACLFPSHVMVVQNECELVAD